ncbi:MAG TPA: response regulator transcription factor [Aquimonas sp.]|jgi:DNA-binding NarL/FixJ family response regulator|nr:response regulator transcription factor [Xanthomonadales bacterium]HRD71884.1 response regulator transcription factor [Aquimonas sp.]HRF55047.1 response regulator transcription factor [Aquimonas sp.]
MRVLLADDHTLVRAGIRRLLEGVAGVEAVDEAQDASEALLMAQRLQPEVAFLDIAMPGRSGLDVLPELRALAPATAVVMMSMHADLAYVRSALERGARGFVVKDSAPAELELALRAVLAGETFLSPRLSSRMMGLNGAGSLRSDLDALSPRQSEILRLMAKGRGTKEIASDLGISVKTVETHRARMMEALGIRRANDLLRFAVQRGLSN